MRLMEQIRKHGDKGLKAFLLIFVISVFAGLGVGTYDFSRRAEQERQAVSIPTAAVVDTSQKDVALTVNGRKVDSGQFNETVTRYQQMMRGQLEDPAMVLYVYAQTANTLMQEEVLLGKAEELGIKVEAKDLADERQKVIDAQGAPAEDTSGNVLGDLTKQLGQRREQMSVFNAALSRMGMTESEWADEMGRQILLRKTREAIQKEADDAKDVKAKATRDLVDAELAKGAAFKELATKYSDAADAATTGGDMTPAETSWLLPGLLSDEINEDKNDIVLFGTAKGELTPWFDVPAGYQRWEVYDRQPVSDAEYESVKVRLTEQFKKEKGEDYTPTEEELKARAYKIKARQLMINKTDPMALQPKLDALYAAAKVEINNPYVLAYQALYDDKLQVPAGYDYDKLVTIAKLSAEGENYNFEGIKGKLERAMPDKADAAAAEEPAASEADAAAAPAAEEAATAEEQVDDSQVDSLEEAAAMMDAAADDAAEPAAGETATEPSAATPAEATPAAKGYDETPTAPIYALGVGLLLLALEGTDADNTATGSFGQAIIAKIYLEWIDKEQELTNQPVIREEARAEIETRLARALKNDDYNAGLYADRGLNLAWLDKTEEAKAALEQAEKYASDQPNGPLPRIKEAYEKLDMQDKVAAIQAKIDAARQKQMQEQIAQQMAAQQAQQQAAGGNSASTPINIDVGGGQ